jgi:hypothetical protein
MTYGGWHLSIFCPPHQVNISSAISKVGWKYRIAASLTTANKEA